MKNDAIEGDEHIGSGFDLWCLTPLSITIQLYISYLTSGAGSATLPEHLSSLPVFSGVRFTRSLVLCACFVDCCLSFDIRILVTSLMSPNSSLS